MHGMPESVGADPGSIWPKLIPRVLDDIESHDTTLIFANSRRQAENTADRLNAAWSAREIGEDDGVVVGSGFLGSAEEDGPFMAHHGSLSDTMRRSMEKQLKAGELPALVGTSSLELGIDIGSIDLVLQLQSPKTVTQGLQRVGRAGHSVGEVSYGKIYATHPEDLMEAVVVAKGMQDRKVEEVSVPHNALDVLAQQIVASVSVQNWSVPELFRLVKGAYSYEDLTFDNFVGVVRLVSGHYPRELFSSLKARVHWDRTRNVLEQLPGTRMMAISNGGAIVDRGAFAVVLPDRKTRIGELDEEFVYESGEGDAFMLGSQVWRVSKIEDDRVIAEPAPGSAPRMPFWRGDFPWRPLDLSYTLASFRAEVARRVRPHIDDETAPDEVVTWLTSNYLVDEAGARQIIDYVRRQLRWSGDISSDKTVIVETYQDSIGDLRIVVHSPFGGKINGPWSVAISRELLRRKKVEPEVQVSDDGFMFRLPQSDDPSTAEFIAEMTSADAKENILDGMIESPLFGAVFRQNAYRALLLPSPGHFRRTPFWLQRLRSKDLLSIAKSFPDFPIVLETYRDALEDFMDMPGLERVLDGVQSGEIEMKFVDSDVPSPVARALDYNFKGFWMYQWDTPKAERGLQALNIDLESLSQLFRNPEAAGLLKSEAIDDVAAIVTRTSPGMKARTATELAQLLVEVGDMTDDEIADRSEEGWRGWIGQLASQGRVELVNFEVDDKSEERWIAAQFVDEYRSAIGSPNDYESARKVVARYLARSGPVSAMVIEARYPIKRSVLHDVLDELMTDARATKGFFTEAGEEEWLDLATLARIQERTLAILRSEVQPSDPMEYQSAMLQRHFGKVSLERTSHESDADICQALEMLQGVSAPVELWGRDILPARVADFSNAHLERVLSSGEFRWVFSQDGDRHTPNVAFAKAGEGNVCLPSETLTGIAESRRSLTGLSASVYELISNEGVTDSETIVRAFSSVATSELADVAKELVLLGLLTANSWSVAAAIARSARASHSDRDSIGRLEGVPRRARHRRTISRSFNQRRMQTMGILASGVQWSATSRFSFLGPELSDDDLARKRAQILLRRHGVVSKRALDMDGLGWDWRQIYSALSLLELRGKARRGYFVKGLPGVQFAEMEFVESMRGARDDDEISMLSAADPAYVFDRRLASVSLDESSDLLEINRNVGTSVVFCGARPLAVVSSNGARINVGDASEELLERALTVLMRRIADAASDRRVVVSEWNEEPVMSSKGRSVLTNIGFRRDYPNMVFDALSLAAARR